jgi:hypothetical protein
MDDTTRRIQCRVGGIMIWDDTVNATLFTVVASMVASLQLLGCIF